jgi:hypothetical protein
MASTQLETFTEGAGKWKKFELKIPEIPVDKFIEVIDKIKEFIDIIAKILDTLLSIAALFLDPLTQAIKSILEAIKELIESFLEDMGGYALYVPFRKHFMTNFLGFGDLTPTAAVDAGIWGGPENITDNTTDPAVREFLVNINRYNGGNVGFYKTVMESLSDEGDINRPQFDSENDWVGGMVIVMGSAYDPFAFLDDLWRLFGLFKFPEDYASTKLPRPKNLKARAVTKVLGGKFSTLLTWDAVENPLTRIEDLGGAYFYPVRFAIIRCKNRVRAMAASNIIELVGSRELSEGLTYDNGNTVVIKEDSLNVLDTSYKDKNIEAKPDDVFYYAIAWKLKAFNSDLKDVPDISGEGVDYDYWYLSNVVQVIPYPTLPASSPPDWVRTPSVASLVPPLADFLRTFMMYFEDFIDKLLGISDLLAQYVQFLKDEVARYEAIVQRILDEIKQLTEMLSFSPSVGVYMRTFKGVGGNRFFLNDLLKSFTLEDAPPFTKGDEYVAGLVLMTGGNKPTVETYTGALKLLFGGEGSQLDVLVEQLQQQIEVLEEIEFDESLQPTVKTTQDTAFDVSMCPLNKCCNPPKDRVAATFASDMTVKK